MDFNQVRYFLALSDTLNFTRAAERCYVSQPALTQAIKRLEDELGGELFSRVDRHITVTRLGEMLHEFFEEIDRARNLVKLTSRAVSKGEVAELHIGIMCTIGPRVLGHLLDDFQKKNPSVSFILHDVTFKEVPGKLISGELDGVFLARHCPPNPDLRYVDLFKESMVVAFPAGHEFENMPSVPLKSIAQQQYVDRLHCEFRDEFISYCEDESIDLNVVYSSQREDWIQSMIRDGVGVTVLPRFSLLRPELDSRSIIEPELSRHVEFVVADRCIVNGAMDRFLAHIDRIDWSHLIGQG